MGAGEKKKAQKDMKNTDGPERGGKETRLNKSGRSSGRFIGVVTESMKSGTQNKRGGFLHETAPRLSPRKGKCIQWEGEARGSSRKAR